MLQELPCRVRSLAGAADRSPSDALCSTLREALTSFALRHAIIRLHLTHRCRAQQAASGLDCVQVLSLCNTGVNSLASFPSLPSLHTLRLSDNKISGGLEHLVSAGLTNLRSLDLAGNTGIAKLEQLAPLKDLPVKCLDLDGCPVKDLPDFSNKLFAMLQELEYLDNVDKNGVGGFL
eukprot:364481-Chlamydomonas_euryale.AAC.7